MEANDNDLGWELVAKEDGVWLVFNDGYTLFNLGPEEQVGNALADWLAQRDFEE